jgi:hypothetical protein
MDDSNTEEGDGKINKELKALVAKYQSKCKFSIDKISYKDARNAYYARYRVGKLY